MPGTWQQSCKLFFLGSVKCQATPLENQGMKSSQNDVLNEPTWSITAVKAGCWQMALKYIAVCHPWDVTGESPGLVGPLPKGHSWQHDAPGDPDTLDKGDPETASNQLVFEPDSYFVLRGAISFVLKGAISFVLRGAISFH